MIKISGGLLRYSSHSLPVRQRFPTSKRPTKQPPSMNAIWTDIKTQSFEELIKNWYSSNFRKIIRLSPHAFWWKNYIKISNKNIFVEYFKENDSYFLKVNLSKILRIDILITDDYSKILQFISLFYHFNSWNSKLRNAYNCHQIHKIIAKKFIFPNK